MHYVASANGESIINATPGKQKRRTLLPSKGKRFATAGNLRAAACFARPEHAHGSAFWRESFSRCWLAAAGDDLPHCRSTLHCVPPRSIAIAIATKLHSPESLPARGNANVVPLHWWTRLAISIRSRHALVYSRP